MERFIEAPRLQEGVVRPDSPSRVDSSYPTRLIAWTCDCVPESDVLTILIGRRDPHSEPSLERDSVGCADT